MDLRVLSYTWFYSSKIGLLLKDLSVLLSPRCGPKHSWQAVSQSFRDTFLYDSPPGANIFLVVLLGSAVDMRWLGTRWL